MSRSCYVLEISAHRQGDEGFIAIFTDADHLRRSLEWAFLDDDDIDFRDSAGDAALHYSIQLGIVEQGTLVASVDLRPDVHVRVADEPSHPAHLAAEILAKHPCWTSFHQDFWIEVDWASIAARIPPLRGEPLRPGDRIPVNIPAELRKGFTYLVFADDRREEMQENPKLGLRYGAWDVDYKDTIGWEDWTEEDFARTRGLDRLTARSSA